MPDFDNLSEYADPILYDLENPDFEPEGPFYLAFARRAGGPVLELGCGTGRFTIPLALEGIDIVGLDLVPGMLERARSKSQGLAVRWVEGDARSFHLDRQFRYIFESGGMFQHLLERRDREAMLARVREHLEPGGIFSVSTLFPHPNLLESDETERDWFTYLNLEGQEVRVSGMESYDPVRQIKMETAIRRWQDAEGWEIVRPAPLALRYTFPQEMEDLLYYNGFTVLERYGDCDFSPLTGESKYLIYVCQ